jgi:hypothetical protein
MLKKLIKLSYFLGSLGLLLTLPVTSTYAEVQIMHTPDEGLQPRLSVDSSGVVHLLYFKKRINRPAAREGNLYYRQYLPQQKCGSPVMLSIGRLSP